MVSSPIVYVKPQDYLLLCEKHGKMLHLKLLVSSWKPSPPPHRRSLRMSSEEMRSLEVLGEDQ
jgi:hypothetical protein